MIRGKSLSLPLLFMLGACASGPIAPPQADQEAKRFDQPAPDKGALYIYRPGWLGLAKAVDVALVGRRNRPARFEYLYPSRRSARPGRDRLPGR